MFCWQGRRSSLFDAALLTRSRRTAAGLQLPATRWRAWKWQGSALPSDPATVSMPVG